MISGFVSPHGGLALSEQGPALWYKRLI